MKENIMKPIGTDFNKLLKIVATTKLPNKETNKTGINKQTSSKVTKGNK